MSRAAIQAGHKNDFQGDSMFEGRIVRVDRFGLGFVEARGTNTDTHQYAFTFDKVEGYRGQPPREIGLEEGCAVRISVRDGLIKSVKISSRP